MYQGELNSSTARHPWGHGPSAEVGENGARTDDWDAIVKQVQSTAKYSMAWLLDDGLDDEEEGGEGQGQGVQDEAAVFDRCLLQTDVGAAGRVVPSGGTGCSPGENLACEASIMHHPREPTDEPADNVSVGLDHWTLQKRQRTHMLECTTTRLPHGFRRVECCDRIATNGC